MNVLKWAILVVMLGACSSLDRNEHPDQPEQKNGLHQNVSGNLRPVPAYRLSYPDKVYPLPPALREISGLDIINKSTVACVQDEEGSVFIYSLDEEEIQKRIPFTHKGDFEELAIVGNDVYIIESSGIIYLLRNYLDEGSAEVTWFSTHLSKKNDPEGMCYDKANNRLLISCKGKGEGKEKNTKAIYAFDIREKKLSDDPVINISQKEVSGALANVSQQVGKRLEKAMDSDEIDKLFTPSGIDIHPLTGELYVLSSQNNLLAVLDSEGNVVHAYQLQHELFTQPEGIAFAPDGDLYISNEGKKGMGNILKFTYEKK